MTEPATLFVPPDWLGEPGPEGLRFRRFRDGASLEVRGTLAELLVSGGGTSHPLLRTVASANPLAAELVGAIARFGPPAPFTRDRLLRSTGYDTLFLELTARCNERCVHCYAESSPEREETLEPGVIDAIAEDAARSGFRRVQLTGGDPLTSPHVLHAARAVRATSIPTLEIYTNGLALRGALLDALAGLEASFAFSFYSHDAAVHDAITRTPGSCARTLRAIRDVAERGLGLRVAIVVTEADADGIEATIATLVANGVPREAISVGQAFSVGRGRYVDLPPLAAPPPGERNRELHAPTEELFAGKLAVGADGSVMPCIFARDTILGNVHETRLADVLASRLPLTGAIDRLLEANAEHSTSLACLDCRLVRGACGPSARRLPTLP